MANKLSETTSPSPLLQTISDQVKESSRGFECDFAEEKPPNIAVQCECPVCLQVLREPYQVSCCGKIYCRACIEPIRDNKKPCPTCSGENFNTFHDKQLQQSLYGFLVFCSHRKEGCEWTGELGQLDKYLNLNPQPEQQFEGCLFAEIRCLFCSQSDQRCKIRVHQSDLCPERPFSCEYCQCNSGYEDIINNHWPVCGFHPVQCPNTCGASPQRQNLEEHASNDCPLTIINCDFRYVGCEVKLPRKAMSDHLNENTVTHVCQLLGNVKNQNETFCKEQDASQEKIAGLRNAQDQSHREIRELKNTQDHLHKQTWRLLLWIILPTVVALVGISIEKVNTLEQELQHQKELLGWIEKVNIPEQEEKVNLPEQEQLGLIEKINRLERELQQKEELFGELTKKVERLEQEDDIQPTYIYVPNFKAHKKDSKPWYSPPFYSNPTLGYKMCLRVDANGDRHGEGTHVSVRIYLMRGEFDDHLKWPFQADITILLLDQRGDERHHRKTITFNSKTPNNVTERVKDGRIFEFKGDRSETGWGKLKFIHHNKLKPIYLKKDSLQFKILVKVLRV